MLLQHCWISTLPNSIAGYSIFVIVRRIFVCLELFVLEKCQTNPKKNVSIAQSILIYSPVCMCVCGIYILDSFKYSLLNDKWMLSYRIVFTITFSQQTQAYMHRSEKAASSTSFLNVFISCDSLSVLNGVFCSISFICRWLSHKQTYGGKKIHR